MNRLTETKFFKNADGRVVKHTEVYRVKGDENELVYTQKDGLLAAGSVEISEIRYNELLEIERAKVKKSKEDRKKAKDALKKSVEGELSNLGLSDEAVKFLVSGR